MWCLETLQQINQAVAKALDEGRSPKEAYAECGIRILGNTPHPSVKSDEKKDKRVPLKVAS